MNLLIVAATEFEIAPLLPHFTTTDGGYTYLNHTIQVLVTGVGMVATTHHLTKMLAHNSFDVVLNMGIAGSFNAQYTIGSVVNVTQDCLAELGAENDNAFIPMDTLGFVPRNQLIINALFNIENHALDQLPKVNGITVNTVHGNAQSIAKVQQLYAPDVETMEGAAVLYVCAMQQQLVVQLRAISNKVEVRNTANWNVALAITSLTTEVLNIMREL